MENPASIAITNAQVTDTLDALLGAPGGITTGSVANHGATGGSIALTGSYNALGRQVIWTIAQVPAGARFEVSFSVVIDPATPDDTIVPNTAAQVSTQDPTGTTSNTVSLSVVAPALSIAKEASRTRAEVGDPIGYTVQIGNISASLNLTNVEVTDTLPRGFRYQEGSAKLDGHTIPDPLGAKRDLIFALGGLASGAGARLTYVAIPAPTPSGSTA